MYHPAKMLHSYTIDLLTLHLQQIPFYYLGQGFTSLLVSGNRLKVEAQRTMIAGATHASF